MDNYNNLMNNEQYNAMVYGNEVQNPHPMTSIPNEMQITSVQPPSDIINLSYHQRGDIQPHPGTAETSTLFPTEPMSSQIQPHDSHLLPPTSPLSQQTTASTVETSVTINQQSTIPEGQQNNELQYVDDVGDMVSSEAQGDVNSENAATNVNETAAGVLASNGDETTENVTAVKGDSPEPNSNETENIANKEPDVDPNQCRVCKDTDQLIDIFAIEDDMRICDIITKICSDVRIHERDFLPHMICLSCLGKLRSTFIFVNQIRATDKELRSKLKRSKKARKTNDFVLVDAHELSEESDDNDEVNDDEEFKVSESEEDSDDDSISESDVDTKPLKKRSNGGRKKSASTTSTPATAPSSSKRVKQDLLTTAKRLKRDIVFIEADDSEEERKVRRERCRDCNKTFNSKNSLKLHRKNVHTDDFLFKCHICSKSFKYSINLSSHMQVHKESYTCDDCGRVFASKSDSKRHALNQHKCSLSYECNKCRRLYCSIKRYQKHRETCSSGSNMSSLMRKKLSKPKEEVSYGSRDLFKSVAPVTTTYWSDSFSD